MVENDASLEILPIIWVPVSLALIPFSTSAIRISTISAIRSIYNIVLAVPSQVSYKNAISLLMNFSRSWLLASNSLTDKMSSTISFNLIK
jgi:hypothetical protein